MGINRRSERETERGRGKYLRENIQGQHQSHLGAGSGHGDQLLVLGLLYIHLTLIPGVGVMHTEEQGLNSLCTEGHLGQGTADILNCHPPFSFLHLFLFPNSLADQPCTK